MRLIAITPIHVTTEELDRRQARYNRLAPQGVTVELRNLSKKTLTALDSPADVVTSDAGIIGDVAELDISNEDFVMPDCVLDPGFRTDSNSNVVGMLQSVMAHLVEAGHKVGAVTRNQTIGDELVRRVHEYGYGENFVGLVVLNLSFDAINDEELWHQSLEAALEKLAASGATVVINGCSAVNVHQSRLKLEVVDPAELALKILAQVNR
jgi:Asp/Glu/hydantoin racemase